MMIPEKKKKRDSHRLRKWWVIAIIAVIVISAAGCMALTGYAVDSMFGTDIVETGESARSYIDKASGGTLPENASEMAFYGTSWLDYLYQMRFSITPDAFDTWLKGAENLCFEPLSADANRGISGTSNQRPWWTPDNAKTYLSAAQCGTNPYFNILVDTTDSDTWTVYLSIFST